MLLFVQTCSNLFKQALAFSMVLASLLLTLCSKMCVVLCSTIVDLLFNFAVEVSSPNKRGNDFQEKKMDNFLVLFNYQCNIPIVLRDCMFSNIQFVLTH